MEILNSTNQNALVRSLLIWMAGFSVAAGPSPSQVVKTTAYVETVKLKSLNLKSSACHAAAA
jgi:hypothetical protein